MTDPPYTQEQLDELAKLAARVDRPDAAEGFERAMRRVLSVTKSEVEESEAAELRAAEDDLAAPDPCDDR